MLSSNEACMHHFMHRHAQFVLCQNLRFYKRHDATSRGMRKRETHLGRKVRHRCINKVKLGIKALGQDLQQAHDLDT